MRNGSQALGTVLESNWIVYQLFDAEGALLYIGKTGNLKHRLVEHRRKQDWGSLIASVTSEEFPDRESASEHETLAIARLRPKMNVVGNREGPRPIEASVAESKVTTCRKCHAMGLVWALGRHNKPYLVEPILVMSSGWGIADRYTFHRCPAYQAGRIPAPAVSG